LAHPQFHITKCGKLVIHIKVINNVDNFVDNFPKTRPKIIFCYAEKINVDNYVDGMWITLKLSTFISGYAKQS